MESDVLIRQLNLDNATSIDLNGFALQQGVAGNGTYTFPLTDGSGNSIPVSITLNSGSLGSNPYIEVSTTDGTHGNNASSTNYLSQYWTVTLNDISSPNYDISAVYQDLDIQGTETQIAGGVWDGSLPWTKYITINTGSNTVSATGITSTSIDFTGITLADPTVTASATNAVICEGDNINLTASGTGDTPLSYSWTGPNSFTSTAQNPTINNASTAYSGTYTVTVTDGNGFTDTDQTTVTVDPASAGGILADDETVCSGTNSTTLTLSGQTGDVQRWEYSINSGSTWNTISTTSTSYTATNLTQTTDYRVVVQSGVCSETTSLVATVTVDPVSVGGTLAGNATVCSGTNSTNLTLSGQTGDVQRWEYSTNGGSTWNTISTTSTSYTATNLTQTMDYRVVVQSGVCNETTSLVATVTVDPVSAGGTASADQTICEGSIPADLTLSGYVGSIQWQWSTDGSTSWTDIGGATGNTLSGATMGSLSSDRYYRAEVTSGVCSVATSTTVHITVNPTPTASISGTQAVCQGDTPLPIVTITNPMSMAVTVTYNINGSGITTLNISAGGTGTISQSTTNAGTFNYNLVSVAYTSAPLCSNPLSGTATITVNPTPTVNAIADQVLCNNTSATGITITGPVAGTTFAWTNSNTAIGLAASGTGNIPAFSTTNGTNGPITGTITVTPTANGCPGTPLTFTITVNPTPTVSITGSTTVCQNDVSPDITFINPLSLPVTVTYRRNSVVQPTINVAANSTATVAVPTNTATTYTYELTSVAFQSNPTCSNGVTGTATVIVNPRANAVPTPASQAICSGETITTIALSSSTNGVTYNWIRNNTATVTGIAASGTGDISGTLTNTTTAPVVVTFTITANINGCDGNPSTATVTVNPIPVVSQILPPNQTRCSGIEAISEIVPYSTTGGTTFTWTRDHVADVTGLAASGTNSVPTTTLTNTTSAPITVTFTFIPRANGCEGLPVTATAVINPTPNITDTTVSICNSGSFDVLPVDGVDGVVPAGTNFSWAIQSSTGGITGATSGSGTRITGALGNSTNSTQTVTYAVTPTFNGCVGEIFLLVVHVTPEPDISNMTATVCSDGTFTITPANGTNGIVPSGTTYNWSAPTVTGGITGGAAGSGSPISGTLTNPTNTAQTATYTVTPAGGSCIGDPFTLTVTVNPVAAINNLTPYVCSGETFTVTPTNGTDGIVPAGTTYSWSAPAVPAGITGGTLGSGATSISGTLTNSTNSALTATYMVTPSFGSCAGTPFTVNVTVNPKPSVNPMTATICSGGTFNLSPVDGTNGTIPAGTTYSWSAPGVSGITGTASGTNETNISGTLINTSTTVKTVTYTVTPAAGGCTGINFTVTVTVNPAPDITDMSANVCSGSAFSIAPVNGTNGFVPAGTTYDWVVLSAPVEITGASAGNGTTIDGNLTNSSNAVQTVVYEVTPISVSCSGDPFILTLTVNPVPDAVISGDATVCYNVGNPQITFTNNVNLPVTVTYNINGGADLTVDITASGTINIPAIVNQEGTFNYNLVSVAYQSTPTCSTPVTGETATITVEPITTAVISATATTICASESVTFTAVVANAGTSPAPTYQWYLNGAAIGGETNLTYTSPSSSLTNGDKITFKVTTLDTPCNGTTTSNTITMTVNPSVIPSVTIYESANPVCDGTSVTFTADPPVNGGTNPTFQWYLNGSLVPGETGTTFTPSGLNDGDEIHLEMVSNAGCAVNPAISNPITMVVNPNLPVSVIVAADANPVCAGTSVTFTATPTNGGLSPTYQWKVNGSNVGTNSPTYTSSTLNDGDNVTVVLTSSEDCATGNPATSDAVTMTVNPNLPVSVSIAPDNNPVCAGTTVNFTATPTNGGSTPGYQWKVNGSNVGTDSPTYSYTPANR